MSDSKDLVLIVDDDESVRSVLQKVILSNGIGAMTAAGGDEALSLVAHHHFDLILMDINLRGADGFEVIRSMRAQNIATPIIIVSGRREDYDTIYGLDIGADDYVTKPFNPVILGAKVKALIRRSRSSGTMRDTVITAGPFVYNTLTMQVFKNGTEVPLSSKETALMKLFIDNVNRIFPKEVIYETVWHESIVDENAIMVYINRLRQKIEDDPHKPGYIRTVRGLGYRFVI